jgi:hypothetical protein
MPVLARRQFPTADSLVRRGQISFVLHEVLIPFQNKLKAMRIWNDVFIIVTERSGVVVSWSAPLRILEVRVSVGPAAFLLFFAVLPQSLQASNFQFIIQNHPNIRQCIRMAEKASLN